MADQDNNYILSNYVIENYEYKGNFHITVSTHSQESQKWINRGFMQLYNFCHVEAINCFKKSFEYDEDIPIALWGISYAYGPHYNNMNICENDYKEAYYYLQKALESIKYKNCAVWEIDLIEALKLRYPENMQLVGEKFQENLINYKNEMKKAYEKYPEDLDITAIYIESIINIHPWQLWAKCGTPKPESIEAKKVIEKSFNLGYHPQTYHLYLHLMEQSPFSNLALPIADKLFENSRGLGHLLHMPSHIYIQFGFYQKSIDCNLVAIEEDEKLAKRLGENNFYTNYRAHSLHFLIWTAMFMGDYEKALNHSLILLDVINSEVIKYDQYMEFYVHTIFHVYIRFGKWNEILSTRIEERPNYKITKTMQRYARSIAYSVLGNTDQAEIELDLFNKSRKEEDPENILQIGNNPASKVFDVAEAMATGELLYRKKEYELAFKSLRKSVELDDGLIYDEPWNFLQPTRHALGALLLEQNHFEESEKVYKKDLEIYPDNIWSLSGLNEIFEKTGQQDLYEKNKKRLSIAQKNSTIDVNVSCFCKKTL